MALTMLRDISEATIVSAHVQIDGDRPASYEDAIELDLLGLLNQTVTLVRAYNNVAVDDHCPLTGETFQPRVGLEYFLEGSGMPVSSELVPARLDTCFKDDFSASAASRPARSFVVTLQELLDVYRNPMTSREATLFKANELAA